jgi:hypothetical protein
LVVPKLLKNFLKNQMGWDAFSQYTIGLYHSLDGIANSMYKLLCFLTIIIILQREESASF